MNMWILCVPAILVFGGSVALYLYLIWHFDHWTKRGVPGPKPRALYGTFPGTITGKRHFIYDLDEVYKLYKGNYRYVGVFVTRNPQLLILDPEMCKDILVKYFKNFKDNESSKWMNRHKEPISGSNPFVLPASEWKVKRAEIMAGLTLARFKAMYPIIYATCGMLLKHLELQVQSCPIGINVKELALRYTGNVVADVVWGIDAGALLSPDVNAHGENSTFLDMAKQMIAQTFKAFKYFFYVGTFPILQRFIYVRFHPEQTDRFFVQLTRRCLQHRQSNDNHLRNDFLQHMLDLHQTSGLNETNIVADMLTFLFDGFETSATLISHCLLLLSRHPDKQELLRQEIRENMTESGGEVDFEKLMRLPYLEQCIAETLRIFTPLPFMAKMCTEDCQLANNNGTSLTVSRGDVCLISLHSLHHDGDYFPQPEEFMPERFSEEFGGTSKYRKMGVYMPFGDGPRMCLGKHFGMAQTKAAVVEITRHFKLKVNQKTRIDNYQAASGFISGLEGGIFVDMTPIADAKSHAI